MNLHARKPLLRCLGWPALEAGGTWKLLQVEPLTQPMDLLLRVVCAGPCGATASLLAASLWPDDSPILRRRALRGAIRRVHRMLGLNDALVLDGNRVRVNDAVLGVDSLRLEAALAPVLNPFRIPAPGDQGRAREILHGTCPEFLPGIEAAWAVAARLRIGDAVSRARQELTQPIQARRTPCPHSA